MEKDTHTEEGFSFNSIVEFDSHISNSIPSYDSLLNFVVQLSDYFMEEGVNNFDIGCSTGKLVKRLGERHPSSKFTGIDNEVNFKDEMDSASTNTNFIFKDIFKVDNFKNSNFNTLIFTLQFLPPHKRLELVKKLYDGLNLGGALVVAEKTLSKSSKFQEILTFLYYDYKRAYFSDKSILEKEKSLRVIMKPMTFQDLENLMIAAGFSEVEIFWKSYNFIGIIAIKN